MIDDLLMRELIFVMDYEFNFAVLVWFFILFLKLILFWNDFFVLNF